MHTPHQGPNQSSGSLPSNAPAVKYNAQDLMKQLEADYGPNGEHMNFGALLIPVFREAGKKIAPDLKITAEQFREALVATSNFRFIERARKDPAGAADEVAKHLEQLARS